MFRTLALSGFLMLFAVTTASAQEQVFCSAQNSDNLLETCWDELIQAANGLESVHVNVSRDVARSHNFNPQTSPKLPSYPHTKTSERLSRQGNRFLERRSFWLTEFGYSLRFSVPTKVQQVKPHSYGYEWIGAESYTPAKRYFTWEVGHMRTKGRGSALGAALFFGTDANDVLRFGVKPRYRRRLDRKTSLDIAPGILIRGSDPLESIFPGFTAHVGLNFEDTFILYGQMEANRTEKYGTDVAWYGGIKLGSSPGLIAGAVYGLIKVIGTMDFGADTGGGGSFGGCGG